MFNMNWFRILPYSKNEVKILLANKSLRFVATLMQQWSLSQDFFTQYGPLRDQPSSLYWVKEGVMKL